MLLTTLCLLESPHFSDHFDTKMLCSGKNKTKLESHLCVTDNSKQALTLIKKKTKCLLFSTAQ